MKIFTPVIWLALLSLAACSSAPTTSTNNTANQGRYSQTHDAPPVNPPETRHVKEPEPRAEPKSRYGNPASYNVNGKTYYVLESAEGYDKTGIASWYGTKFQGHRTSNGETYDMYQFTAANKELPLPTYVKVTNLDNGKSVIVRVNDRGPFHDNRLIDLSWLAANRLDLLGHGTGRVRVQAISPTAASETDRPAATQAAPSTSEQRFLQLGAFKSKQSAEQLKQQVSLITQSQPFLIVHIDGLHKLLMGPFASESERQTTQSVLTSNGIASIPRNQ